MILGIEKELSIFCVAFLDGIIVSLSYGALRVFRRMMKHSMFWVALEDVLFWLITALYMFWEIYRMCAGELRWYFVVSVLIGGLMGSTFIHKLMKKHIDNSPKTR